MSAGGIIIIVIIIILILILIIIIITIIIIEKKRKKRKERFKDFRMIQLQDLLSIPLEALLPERLHRRTAINNTCLDRKRLSG